MITQKHIAAALIGAAAFLSPAFADAPRLGLPVDCDLGSECFIQQYMDHDAGPGAKDYRCAPLSYDTHSGTDFAVATLQQMRAGVDVIASAPGTVRGVRDGVADRYYSDANAETVRGRECGNGVVIAHEDGWETQYCHLLSGSVAVRNGQTVRRGDVLGQIGLSGRTQFPHVHLSVRKDGQQVDPFDPDGRITCGAPSQDTLWIDAPDYLAGGILEVGFSDGIPDYDDVKSGRANDRRLPADAPALVVYGYAFGGQAGDVLHLTLTGPGGEVANQRVELPKNQAQFFRASGRRLRAEAWPTGRYNGTVSLIRNGRTISTRSAKLTVR